MKKLSIFTAVVFTLVAGLTLMFYQMCEILDQEMIEPMVTSNLEKHNFKIVNEKYCSTPGSDYKAPYACELLKLSTIDDNAIKQIFSKKYQFKKKWVDKNYGFKDTGDSRAYWILSLFASGAYDAYMMEYSNEYIENWNYSHYNAVENYRNFTARFATAIFTHHYEEDHVIFKDDELFIVSEYEKNKLFVRRIYGDVEEYYAFVL